jgi:hypothetical protein
MRARALTAMAFAALVACKPDLPARESIVTSQRLLAIKAEPAEAAPGAQVTYAALVADASGTVQNALIAWSTCASPPKPGENGAVASVCQHGGDLRAIATASGSVPAAMPTDACALFGPDAPAGGYRPADPDATGGYYQPVVALTSNETSTFLHRVACNLANAPADLAAQFGKQYVKNANPKIRALRIPDRVDAGARASFAIDWSSDDAESYVAFDAATQSIVSKREAMRVSWFATAGDYDDDRTGRAEDDGATTSSNGWLAPSSAQTVHVFVVIRDSRGGVDFAAKDVVVGAP